VGDTPDILIGGTPREDYHNVVAAELQRPRPEWKRRPGRPVTSWLCTVESDLKPLNLRLNSAWRKASDTAHWREVVSRFVSEQLDVEHQLNQHHVKMIVNTSHGPRWF